MNTLDNDFPKIASTFEQRFSVGSHARFAESANLDKQIEANLRGLGYGL